MAAISVRDLSVPIVAVNVWAEICSVVVRGVSMKKTGYITTGAILAALSLVVMLVSHFPFLTYSLPAVASLFIMVAVLELGTKWALGSYIAAAFLTVLFAEKEAAALYVLFFGYYPIAKVYFERIKNRVLNMGLKLLLFNGVLALIYLVLLSLIGLQEDFLGFSRYMVYVMWAAANAVFIMYDRILVSLSTLYMYRLHGRISRFIKK